MTEGKTIPLTPMRRAIAQTVVKSKQEIPHFYLEIEVDLSRINKLRNHWNQEHSPKPSVNHFILKAIARALVEVPELGATFTPHGIIMPSSVNLGFVVAVEDGLLIPVIRDAQKLSLLELAAKSRELTKKAREKKLSPEEYQGGNFTVSNLGMFGVKSFAAIIPPGQGGILAVGATGIYPRWNGNKWQPTPLVSLTLSVDHRVVDGIKAVEFLRVIRQILENGELT